MELNAVVSELERVLVALKALAAVPSLATTDDADAEAVKADDVEAVKTDDADVGEAVNADASPPSSFVPSEAKETETEPTPPPSPPKPKKKRRKPKKRYYCELCEKSFAHRQSLWKHCRAAHRPEPKAEETVESPPPEQLAPEQLAPEQLAPEPVPAPVAAPAPQPSIYDKIFE